MSEKLFPLQDMPGPPAPVPETIAYRAGQLAHHDCTPLTANPHPPGAIRRAWHAGWCWAHYVCHVAPR